MHRRCGAHTSIVHERPPHYIHFPTASLIARSLSYASFLPGYEGHADAFLIDHVVANVRSRGCLKDTLSTSLHQKVSGTSQAQPASSRQKLIDTNKQHSYDPLPSRNEHAKAHHPLRVYPIPTDTRERVYQVPRSRASAKTLDMCSRDTTKYHRLLLRAAHSNGISFCGTALLYPA